MTQGLLFLFAFFMSGCFCEVRRRCQGDSPSQQKHQLCKQSKAITSDALPLGLDVAGVLGVGSGVGRTMFSWAT